MHPPLHQPHPLCREEVTALIRCHDENPFLKFVNVCGDAKTALDLCFREEKVLRKKLNPRVSTTMPSPLQRAAAAAPGGAGSAGASSGGAAGAAS